MKLLLLLLLATTAYAANFSVTYSDPNCANFGIAGSNNAFTVACATTPIPPQPPQPWPPNCPGFAATRAIDMGFPASGVSFYTSTVGGFGPNQALVIRLSPPKGYVSIPNQSGSIAMAEYGDPLTMRYAVLSTTACDFTGNAGPFTVPALQVSSTISWSLQLARKDSPAIVMLTPGVQYYLNVRNTNASGANTCYTPTCNMIINWLRPPITAGTTAAAKAKAKK